jgi:hypothetical protein
MQICRQCLFALQQRLANEGQDATTCFEISTRCQLRPSLPAAMRMFVPRDQSLAEINDSHAGSA